MTCFLLEYVELAASASKMRLCRIFFKSEVFKDPTEGTSADKRSRKAAFFNE